MSGDLEFIKLNVQGRIAEMTAKLHETDPLLPTHLAAIHSSLIQYEELVHLLPDEQIKQLVAGQQKHLGVVLMAEVTGKTRATVSKRIPKTSVDDL